MKIDGQQKGEKWEILKVKKIYMTSDGCRQLIE